MNENIRVSDADREHVVERLREHYAAGRLTSDELDERVTAALSAKTYGDLRPVMTDLPEPETVGAGAAGPAGTPRPPRAPPHPSGRRAGRHLGWLPDDRSWPTAADRGSCRWCSSR
jgi:hypothetical protein